MKKMNLFSAAAFAIAITAAFAFTPTNAMTKRATYYEENSCSSFTTLPADCSIGTKVCKTSNNENIHASSCTGPLVQLRN